MASSFQHGDREVSQTAILVVEDDWLQRAAAVDYLEEAGLPVLEAQSGDDAIELLQANPQIGAVFSDVQMPGLVNGIALARWIARERPEVGVLLTSGEVMDEEVPGWPLVAKPYRMGDIERRLRNLMPH